MKQAHLWLTVGMMASAIAGGLVYTQLGMRAALLAGLILAIVVGTTIHYVFRYYLPNRKFKDFLQGRLFFECQRNGKCCNLWVELDKADYDRVIAHARKNDIKKEVIFKRGDKYWLAHKKGGACIFLEKNRDGENTCTIYEIRPTACRLYPIVPEEGILRLDIGCSSCLNTKQGMSLVEYLQSQGVLSYVRRNWCEADKYLPKR